MSNTENEDSLEWHRYVAAKSNNRAWELSTKHRNAAEDQEMLTAAHASAYHWSLVGVELNVMRSTMLLAEVHALLSLGLSSYQYAQDMRAYFLSNDTPDWELALTHTVYAHAAYVSGNMEEHASSFAAAEQSIEAIAEHKEREIVLDTFDHVPKPNA